jgi:hypothetical protein
MNLQDDRQGDQHRFDAYANVLALAGVSSLPLMAILAVSAFALFVGRALMRLLP